MRTGPRLAVTLLAVGLAAAGCGGDDSAEAARELRRRTVGEGLKIEVADGGRVAGNVAEIEVTGAGVALVEPEGDTSGKTAHIAVFVDKPPVAFGAEIPDDDEDVLHSAETAIEITGLSAGSHKVTAVLADGNHRRIGETAAETTLSVSGPTLHASAPATVEGKSVSITVDVRGVAPRGPDGDTSGTTGHWEVFIDRDPTAEDVPVPTEANIIHTADRLVQITDLPAGEHEVWVVLARGDHVPFKPMIADRVTFEVT